MSKIIATTKAVRKGEELIAVKRTDFKMFRKWKNEVNEALLKVKRGREEYKKNKTVAASSPRRFR